MVILKIEWHTMKKFMRASGGKVIYSLIPIILVIIGVL
jgi:hypothetical protein